MTDTDCDELNARADMLHAEARMGVEEALRRGAGSEGFAEQVEIAAYCEHLAAETERRIAETC